MSYTKDLETKVYIFPDDPCHRAIGWLSRNYPFETETPSDELVQKLIKIVRFRTSDYRYPDGVSLFFDLFGAHGCEFCYNVAESGYFFLPGQDVIYVAPTMIYHYVESHHYKPPIGFVQAVLSAPPVESDAYREAIRVIAGD